jgi:hypothetical protein
MANVIPKQEKLLITDGWAGQNLRACLLISTYVYNHATDYTYTAVSGSEISGTGYTAGGELLTSLDSDYVDTSTVYFDAADVQWGPGATFSNARYLCIYDTVANRVRQILDFDSAQSCTNSTFTVQFHANGIVRIS